ncbi:hypothetical protein HRE53_23830 [Acaryochloris sp. 'Moss Beach']|uniref:hypothetical protein n=1 Tax=Acaryochloris sp. 'Moss Beach' TaxID=2740837 RepID=UPI001F185CFA|nr:hypothetical protein [Acaryochloris sp. 'Moss Beach']UJB69352.1 hypothetical protein HRE53_23830 [Acaryochloris sp. 'Moss Beach']
MKVCVKSESALGNSILRTLAVLGVSFGMAVVMPSEAFADTVNLSGTVSSTLTLSTTATGGASTLPLDGGAAGNQQIIQVADLGINTNNEQGYTLTVTSGDLTKSGGTAISYQTTTTATGVSAVTGDFAVASGLDHTFATSAANASGSGDRDLWVQYTPAALQDPGSYTGAITVTVADN